MSARQPLLFSALAVSGNYNYRFTSFESNIYDQYFSFTAETTKFSVSIVPSDFDCMHLQTL